MARYHDLGFHLDERPACRSQEVPELTPRESALTFSYVARDRNCRPSHLAGETVCFLLGEHLRVAVDFRNHRDGLLPHDQFFVRVSHHRVPLETKNQKLETCK